jgi:hypothetical protein
MPPRSGGAKVDSHGTWLQWKLMPRSLSRDHVPNLRRNAAATPGIPPPTSIKLPGSEQPGSPPRANDKALEFWKRSPRNYPCKTPRIAATASSIPTVAEGSGGRDGQPKTSAYLDLRQSAIDPPGNCLLLKQNRGEGALSPSECPCQQVHESCRFGFCQAAECKCFNHVPLRCCVQNCAA